MGRLARISSTSHWNVKSGNTRWTQLTKNCGERGGRGVGGKIDNYSKIQAVGFRTCIYVHVHNYMYILRNTNYNAPTYGEERRIVEFLGCSGVSMS